MSHAESLPFPLRKPVPDLQLLCTRCETLKPADQFNEVDGSAERRGDVCLQCQLNARRDLIVSKRRVAEGELYTALVGQMRKPIEAPHISELVEKVMCKFGGVDAFAEFYHEQLFKAAALRPGSKVVLDGCKAIGQMINQSTQHRHTAPDVSMLSEQDLEREAKTLAVRVFNPEPSLERTG